MKSILASFSIASILLIFSGCATTTPVGAIFTDVTLPLNATSVNGVTKKGEATCTSILGLVATGDCSIETAAQNGKSKLLDLQRIKFIVCLGYIAHIQQLCGVIKYLLHAVLGIV